MLEEGSGEERRLDKHVLPSVTSSLGAEKRRTVDMRYSRASYGKKIQRIPQVARLTDLLSNNKENTLSW